MSKKTVDVTFTVDTSVFVRRLNLLREILKALSDASDFEQAYVQFNKTMSEFEREITRFAEATTDETD